MGPSQQHMAAMKLFCFLQAFMLAAILFSMKTEARFIKTEAKLIESYSMCHGIDHPELCIPIAKQAHTGKFPELAKLTIMETMSKASEAVKLASRLKLHKKKGSMEQQLLDVCSENFDSMTSDLQEAMKGFKGGSTTPIRTNLSALITYLETCVDGYSETPGVKSPFDSTIRPMKKLVDNLFWLADKMKV